MYIAAWHYTAEPVIRSLDQALRCNALRNQLCVVSLPRKEFP
jgi:hypothetical protein